MRTAPVVLIAALLSGACATTGTDRLTDYATQLCVTNATSAYGTLRIYVAGRSMRVEPNQRECLMLRGGGVVGVGGSTIGGGSLGPVRVRDRIELDGGCWSWRVENVAGSFPVPCGGDGGAAPLVMADTMPIGWLRVAVHEEWGAFTTCATRPKTWYGHEIRPTLRPMIEAHEANHRALAAQFPSCADFYIWVRASLANNIELEARAFCAGAKADAATDRYRSLDDAITQHAAWLSHGYPFGLSEAEAEVEIRKYCGPRGSSP